jgi:glycosyltransferase involved in cell wall biosynthesis
MIGEGPEKRRIELKVKELGLEQKVIIKEPISHLELLKEIRKSYLCILPSLTEISPTFALECIKLKKPIILTKNTGIYEEFKNHLVFINPEDKEDLGQKITSLLDRQNHQKYQERIKDASTSYSWEDVIKKHILVFQKVL